MEEYPTKEISLEMEWMDGSIIERAWLVLGASVLMLGTLFAVITVRMRAKRRQFDFWMHQTVEKIDKKIAVFEDLSDRVDRQMKQWSAVIDDKVVEVKKAVLAGQNQCQKIDQSMKKSLEVAKIFEDRIPHQEILERQTMKSYVEVAKLAHQGKSVNEIVQLVQLPRGQVELIAKLNRDELLIKDDEEAESTGAEKAPPDESTETIHDSMFGLGELEFQEKGRRQEEKEQRNTEKENLPSSASADTNPAPSPYESEDEEFLAIARRFRELEDQEKWEEQNEFEGSVGESGRQEYQSVERDDSDGGGAAPSIAPKKPQDGKRIRKVEFPRIEKD